MKVLALIISLLIAGVFSAKLPEYLKKCKKGPEGAKCVIENGIAAVTTLSNKGEPKFKLQGLKPVHIDKIALQATQNLKIVLENANVFGFETLQISNGHINDNEIAFKGHMGRMELVSKYDIDGRILILPIRGNGDCNITIVDADFDYRAKLSIEERKGKKYYKVESNENTVLTMDNIQRVFWQFNNLFNGDERLGPEMNRFLNENWKDVFAGGKPAMQETTAYSVFNYFINGYLHFIPIDELFEA